jgi:hypothetical protein
LVTLLDIEDAPQVPEHRRADARKGEQPDHLAAEGTSEGRAGGKHPSPPLARELAVSLLVELDVAEERESHEEHKGGVQEDEAGLGDVAVV